MNRHKRAQSYRLRWSEEARDRAHEHEDHIDMLEAGNEDQSQNENGADQVAGDHHTLHVPAINENAGERSNDGDRDDVGYHHVRDLQRRAVPAERDQVDHSKDSEEVTEDADPLREPKPFEP